MSKISLLLILAVCALPSLAQNTVKEALAKHWKTSEDFTLAVAKLMPAPDYGFKPVPKEMGFGQVLIQVGAANLNACANAGGVKRPDVPSELMSAMEGKGEASKEQVMKFLESSFGFCDETIASITNEKLDAVVGPANRKMTGFEWLWAYFTHTAHHRGQLEVYLRLKGIEPPKYEF